MTDNRVYKLIVSCMEEMDWGNEDHILPESVDPSYVPNFDMIEHFAEKSV